MAPGQLGELLSALVEPRHRPPCPAAPSRCRWRRPNGSCGALAGWGRRCGQQGQARALSAALAGGGPDPEVGESGSGDHKIRECPLQTAPHSPPIP